MATDITIKKRHVRMIDVHLMIEQREHILAPTIPSNDK
jgi:pentose-5-phosphate-3-epimerase